MSARADAFEAAWLAVGKADAAHFRENPGHRYLVRPAYRVEIMSYQGQGIAGSPGTKPAVVVYATRKANGYQLNRVYVTIPKEIDLEECGVEIARAVYGEIHQFDRTTTH